MRNPYLNDIYYGMKRKRNQGSVEYEHGSAPEVSLPRRGKTLLGGDDPDPVTPAEPQLSLAEELWPDETMGYDFMVRKRQEVEKTLHSARAALAEVPGAAGGGAAGLSHPRVEAVREAERNLARINDSIARLFNPAYHAPMHNQDYERRENSSGPDTRREASSALGGTQQC